MVNVPTGGRKKKLTPSIADSDVVDGDPEPRGRPPTTSTIEQERERDDGRGS